MDGLDGRSVREQNVALFWGALRHSWTFGLMLTLKDFKESILYLVNIDALMRVIVLLFWIFVELFFSMD